MAIPPKEIQIVISHGQSLSLGAGGYKPISTSAIYPESVLTVNTDAQGRAQFVNLVAEKTESPIVSMLNTIQFKYLNDGQTGPTLVGVATGTSGKPLLSLYLTSSDRYQNLSTAVESTENGQFFYVYSEETRSYLSYANSGGIPILIRSTDYEPNLFDNVVQSLKAIKSAADSNGYAINPKLVFSFIQGASDSQGAAGTTYSQQLEMLHSRVSSTAKEILQTEAEIIFVAGQTRYNYPSEQQLSFVQNTNSTYLGAIEFPYRLEHPAGYDWRTETFSKQELGHMNELGYVLLGQATGNIIYDALTGRVGEDAFVRIDSASVDGNTVILRVAGLKGHLVSDTTVYDATGLMQIPSNLGFSLSSGSDLTIVAARISGSDEITLTFNAPVTSNETLSIGKNSGSEGTPLRDSVTKEAINFYENSELAGRELKNFLPNQTIVIDPMGAVSGTLATDTDARARRTVFGSDSGDLMLGSEAAEVLWGGRGDDTLVGGGGYDLLFGGNGADRFVLSWHILADTIADFSPHNGDVIDLGTFGIPQESALSNPDKFIQLRRIDDDSYRLMADETGSGESFVTVFVIENQITDLVLPELLRDGSIVWGSFDVNSQWNAFSSDPAGRNSLDVSLTRLADYYVCIDTLDYFISAGAGNDTIIGGLGREQISGGVGNDLISSGGGDDTIVFQPGRNGYDSIDGGDGIDQIIASADGVDIGLTSVNRVEIISAYGYENVCIVGGSGGDFFDFSSMSVIGIAAIDVGAGNDTVLGSTADDVIYGGSGNDLLCGGGGNDTFRVGASAGTDTIDGEQGTDRIEASAHNVTLTVTGTNIVSVESISSAGFAGFKLVGTTAANILDFSGVALSGIALVDGGSGNDVIIGSSGADYIEGGTGRDMLTGGAGADIFIFRSTAHSKGITSIDRITDFAKGQDKVDLSVIDASTLAIGNNSFEFIGASAFSGIAGQLRVDSTTMSRVTRILADVDGNLSADMEIHLAGTIVLQASDFIL